MVTLVGRGLMALATNLNEVTPPGTYRMEGTATLLGWLLVRPIVIPPLGVTLPKLKLPTANLPARTVAGLNVTDVIVGEAAVKVTEIGAGPLSVAVQTLVWTETQPLHPLTE